ncbi:hypothetical protein L3X38_023451 [Prunus dulcis]|uniref:Uncharacterized protein n=1 Tax=Prunus dulcis TaxID=3755 RepID=A0AAD4VXW0_PRUDU|nr:hypothetical protein L3X38_023451 [Prunus dulcis]
MSFVSQSSLQLELDTCGHTLAVSSTPFLSCVPSLKLLRRCRCVGEQQEPLTGMSTLDATMVDSCGARPKAPSEKMGPVEKEASVHEEMKRMQKLPANSTYVTHRLRVLNKILQLLSIQRSASQEQELELLFAGLSL